jgi:hypothetical protein
VGAGAGAGAGAGTVSHCTLTVNCVRCGASYAGDRPGRGRNNQDKAKDEDEDDGTSTINPTSMSRGVSSMVMCMYHHG